MKKAVLFLLLLTVALFILTACGSDQPYVPEEPQSPESQEPVDGAQRSPSQDEPDLAGEEPADETQPDFALRIGDFIIEMNTDVSYTLEALGEPRAVFEEPSCAFDGIDRVFGYPDLQIHTYPVGDADYIHTVMFLSDLVRTTEGRLRIRHSSLQDVIEAYGDEYVHEAGMYTYTRGLTTLEFYIENDTVEGITYGFIIEE